MRLFLRLTALVIFGLCVLPLIAADDVKPPAKDAPKKDADVKDAPKKDGDAKDAPKKDADAKDKKTDEKKDEKKDSPWVRVGTVSGELVGVDESKKTIKVKITTVVQRVDQNEANAIA